MAFKKTNDVGRNAEISEEELEQEEIHVQVENIDVKFHNPYKSKEEAQDAVETEEIVNLPADNDKNTPYFTTRFIEF